MNENNLFSFPGESAGQTGRDIFSSEGFTDLGSADDMENPFENMGAPADVTPIQEPAPQADGQPPQDTVPVQQTQPQAAPQQALVQGQIQQAAAQTAPRQAQTIPQASPVSGSQSQTSAAPGAAEEPNPLLAAMDLQEQSNARQAAAPVFAQLPVFSYNGNEEPIENTEQTFEELRLAKADDFPEFDEAQSISWSVTYGKISKSVDKPRKTKIGDLKREIESSKEFMDALKKSKDKHPKCIVKPTVKMQKKGEASYKGIFPRLADARASDKTICFIPAQDGRVYERRVTGAGEFITPTSGVTYLDEIRAGFAPALPRIPCELMSQAIALFRYLMDDGEGGPPLEALVHIYWDREEEKFFLHVPVQTVGKTFVDATLDMGLLNDERYLHYADLHSHNDMPAKFSPTDDRDERANRVYMVVGRLDRYFPEISVRICNGGHFCYIPPEQVLEPMFDESIPLEWLQNIRPAREAMRPFDEVAA